MKRATMKPRTDAEWAACRCRLSCKVGRDVLDGKTAPPPGTSPLEYAVYNLLHSVEELSWILLYERDHSFRNAQKPEVKVIT
jgi:hypothetical protein